MNKILNFIRSLGRFLHPEGTANEWLDTLKLVFIDVFIVNLLLLVQGYFFAAFLIDVYAIYIPNENWGLILLRGFFHCWANYGVLFIAVNRLAQTKVQRDITREIATAQREIYYNSKSADSAMVKAIAINKQLIDELTKRVDDLQ